MCLKSNIRGLGGVKIESSCILKQAVMLRTDAILVEHDELLNLAVSDSLCSMLKKVLLLVVVLLPAVALFYRGTKTMHESIRIKSPAYFVFAQINMSESWRFWFSPLREGSQSAVSYEAVKFGAGAGLKWSTGKVAITKSEPNLTITTEMELDRSLQIKNSNFEFNYAAGLTDVTWKIDYEANLLTNYNRQEEIANLKKMMAESLKALKLHSEAQAPSPH